MDSYEEAFGEKGNGLMYVHYALGSLRSPKYPIWRSNASSRWRAKRAISKYKFDSNVQNI